MDYCLIMKSSDGTERRFPVRESPTVIGRASRCHIRIAIPSVADQHCQIVLDGSRLHLKDLDSDAGTFVNGQRVRDATLAEADQVRVGPVTFEIRPDRTTGLPERDLLDDGTVGLVPEISVSPQVSLHPPTASKESGEQTARHRDLEQS